MSAKKKHIITEEMHSLKPYFLLLNGVYFAVVLIIFFATGFDYTLLTGAVYGNVICVLNFYLLGRAAQTAVRKPPKSAQLYMNVNYCLRYLGLFLAMTVAAIAPFLSLYTALIPLLFAKLAITIRAIREKEQ